MLSGIILIHILAPQFYLFQRGSNISRGGLPPHHCSFTFGATPQFLLSSSEVSALLGLRFPLHSALWALAPAYGGTSIHLSTSLPISTPPFLSGSLPFRSAPDWNYLSGPTLLGWVPAVLVGSSIRSTPSFHFSPHSLVALLDHHLGICGLPAI